MFCQCDPRVFYKLLIYLNVRKRTQYWQPEVLTLLLRTSEKGIQHLIVILQVEVLPSEYFIKTIEPYHAVSSWVLWDDKFHVSRGVVCY